MPLTPPQSWSALLQGTPLAGLPLQSLSLQQALEALESQPTGTGIGSVPLGAIGMRGSMLGSLTPEAVGLTEFEAYVARLRNDLDEIVAEARRRFADAKAAGPQPLFPDRQDG